jgi:putative oxidoreductase
MATTRQDFDLTNPAVVVRVMLGLLYVPHSVFKLTAFAGAQAAFAKMASSRRCSGCRWRS